MGQLVTVWASLYPQNEFVASSFVVLPDWNNAALHMLEACTPLSTGVPGNMGCGSNTARAKAAPLAAPAVAERDNVPSTTIKRSSPNSKQRIVDDLLAGLSAADFAFTQSQSQ